MAYAAQSLTGAMGRWLGAGVLLALAGCAARLPRGTGAEDQPTPPALAGAPADASFDWHSLVLMPFGTVLNASPALLHEVLLFHDESQASANGNRDCYTVDGTPPLFLGRQPQEYLLCFDHDRLNRIEASVQLAHAKAEPTFARACAFWLEKSTATAGTTQRCEGRSGTIAFSARLASASGAAGIPVSITLSPVVPDPADSATVDTAPNSP